MHRLSKEISDFHRWPPRDWNAGDFYRLHMQTWQKRGRHVVYGTTNKLTQTAWWNLQTAALLLMQTNLQTI